MPLLTCGATAETQQPGSAGPAWAGWVRCAPPPQLLHSQAHPPTLRLLLIVGLCPPDSLPTTALPGSPSMNFSDANVVKSTPLWLHWGSGREEQTEKSSDKEEKNHRRSACHGGQDRRKFPKEERPSFGCAKFHEKRAQVNQRANAVYVPSSPSPETSCPKDATSVRQASIFFSFIS